MFGKGAVIRLPKLLWLTVVLVLTAAEQNTFERGRELYFQGADGLKGGFSRAAKIFDELHRRRPRDPLIEVYFGSLQLLEASHTWALWKKNALSTEGLRSMDSAVSVAPDDLEIRFIRAVTTRDLPGFFHRDRESESDFAFLASRAEVAAKRGIFEPRLAAASLYFWGETQKRRGRTSEAEKAWRKAIEIAPQSRAAIDSREALRDPD